MIIFSLTMAYRNDNQLNLELISWNEIIKYLKENIQLKRSNPNDHWQELLNERVANSHRELAHATPAVNNYMQWIRARGKNVKGTPKSIPSSILGNRKKTKHNSLKLNYF